MRLLPILAFIPTACLGVLYSWATLFIAFLFDEPYRSFGREVARYLIAACFLGYPVFWLIALAVAIVGLARGWPNRVLVSAAFFPYMVAAFPFLMMAAFGD